MAQQVKAPGPTLEEESALNCPLTTTLLPVHTHTHTHTQREREREIFK